MQNCAIYPILKAKTMWCLQKMKATKTMIELCNNKLHSFFKFKTNIDLVPSKRKKKSEWNFSAFDFDGL